MWDFVIELGGFKGGIVIYHDREVPKSVRLLMLQGAEVIFNPLGTTYLTSDIHRCLLWTRAFENEVYLFQVNHATPRQNGYSMAIDYEGDIVKGLREEGGVLMWPTDLDALNDHRSNGIYELRHRRRSYTVRSRMWEARRILMMRICHPRAVIARRR